MLHHVARHIRHVGKIEVGVREAARRVSLDKVDFLDDLDFGSDRQMLHKRVHSQTFYGADFLTTQFGNVFVSSLGYYGYEEPCYMVKNYKTKVCIPRFCRQFYSARPVSFQDCSVFQ